MLSQLNGVMQYVITNTVNSFSTLLFVVIYFICIYPLLLLYTRYLLNLSDFLFYLSLLFILFFQHPVFCLQGALGLTEERYQQVLQLISHRDSTSRPHRYGPGGGQRIWRPRTKTSTTNNPLAHAPTWFTGLVGPSSSSAMTGTTDTEHETTDIGGNEDQGADSGEGMMDSNSHVNIVKEGSIELLPIAPSTSSATSSSSSSSSSSSPSSADDPELLTGRDVSFLSLREVLKANFKSILTELPSDFSYYILRTALLRCLIEQTASLESLETPYVDYIHQPATIDLMDPTQTKLSIPCRSTSSESINSTDSIIDIPNNSNTMSSTFNLSHSKSSDNVVNIPRTSEDSVPILQPSDTIVIPIPTSSSTSSSSSSFSSTSSSRDFTSSKPTTTEPHTTTPPRSTNSWLNSPMKSQPSRTTPPSPTLFEALSTSSTSSTTSSTALSSHANPVNIEPSLAIVDEYIPGRHPSTASTITSHDSIGFVNNKDNIDRNASTRSSTTLHPPKTSTRDGEDSNNDGDSDDTGEVRPFQARRTNTIAISRQRSLGNPLYPSHSNSSSMTTTGGLYRRSSSSASRGGSTTSSHPMSSTTGPTRSLYSSRPTTNTLMPTPYTQLATEAKSNEPVSTAANLTIDSAVPSLIGTRRKTPEAPSDPASSSPNTGFDMGDNDVDDSLSCPPPPPLQPLSLPGDSTYTQPPTDESNAAAMISRSSASSVPNHTHPTNIHATDGVLRHANLTGGVLSPVVEERPSQLSFNRSIPTGGSGGSLGLDEEVDVVPNEPSAKRRRTMDGVEHGLEPLPSSSSSSSSSSLSTSSTKHATPSSSLYPAPVNTTKNSNGSTSSNPIGDSSDAIDLNEYARMQREYHEMKERLKEFELLKQKMQQMEQAFSHSNPSVHHGLHGLQSRERHESSSTSQNPPQYGSTSTGISTPVNRIPPPTSSPLSPPLVSSTTHTGATPNPPQSLGEDAKIWNEQVASLQPSSSPNSTSSTSLTTSSTNVPGAPQIVLGSTDIDALEFD